jgi:hypothetical protein
MRLFLNLLRQLGFDPIRLILSLRNLPLYFKTAFLFIIKKPKGNLQFSPALLDFRDEAGSAKGHYFWQDLITAKMINSRNPYRHVDIGSRIDGFIAHLLSFRSVEIIDVRPVKANIPDLVSLLGNAQENLVEIHGKFSSVSSLHSIEHFGLGRYGDPLDPEGHVKGLLNISNLVEVGGFLYVSFPIGKPTTQFNAQRIIHPEWPVDLLKDFTLEQFILIPWKDEPIYGVLPADVDLSINGQCGLYVLKRVKNP